MIILSAAAAAKYKSLDDDSKNYINNAVDEIILSMPVGATDSSAWPTDAPKTKSFSPSGLTKNTSGSSLTALAIWASVWLLCSNALSSASLQAASLVDDRLLRAVSIIESGGDHSAKGDYLKGTPRALGAFQFWRGTWEHTTSLRRKAGQPTYGYSAAHNLLASQAYARTYLKWLESGLKRNGVANPTRGQIFAAFNCGLTGFKRRGFQLSRCPAHTRRAAERIEELCR